MKLSIIFTLFILALAFGLGWRDRQEIAALRVDHEQLAAQAATLGIASDPGNPDGRLLVTKRSVRGDKHAAAKQVAAGIIALAMEKAGGTPDESAQKRLVEFMERMAKLDAAQSKYVISEIRAATNLNDAIRESLLDYCMMSLAKDNPQALLALLTGSSDFTEKKRMGENVVSIALGRWADHDPIGAMEWIRKNSAGQSEPVTENAKRSVISAAAANDPGLAFQLLGELKPQYARQAVDQIMQAATTPEERTAALAALRGHLAGIEDQDERRCFMEMAFSSLAIFTARDGFQVATRWISEAGLTAEEMEGYTENLSQQVKPAESGQWIEWVGEKIPPDNAEILIEKMVSNWTQNDYIAAGTWLSNTPNGQTKHIAISSYAATVARYDPETAAKWALILPAGEERDMTLSRVLWNWPENDPAGAAAFAAKHGIEP